MGQTSILEQTEDTFDSGTGEITRQSKKVTKKTKIAPTDEFIKVSKYLNVIFAYNNIPLSLVPISLLIAQQMEFKTNKIYLIKHTKEEMAQMLNCSLIRVNSLIQDCKKYDIIRQIDRGIYEVNGFLFSTGSIVETRNLQAHFDIDSDTYSVYAEQKNLITGETVRKAVTNKKNNQIPGQMSFNDLLEQRGGK